MANPLTGDFEAVVHVSVRQVNGLLATLHQNREIPDASPTLLHSGSVRIGTAPKGGAPQLESFGGWFRQAAGRLMENDPARRDLQSALQTVPPGAAKRLEKAAADWLTAVRTPANSDEVRGLAQVQVSTPMLSLAAGATDSLIVSTFVRAHYIPDPGSQPLPAPIHGEVWVAYGVQRDATNQRLVVTPPANDAQIQFVPESGTVSSAEAKTIAREVRTLVRGKAFQPHPVNLPPDFPFAGFIAIGSPVNRQNPGDQALALPIQLSSLGAPAGNLHSITAQLIRGMDDIGVAISREFFDRQLQPLTVQVRTQVEAIRIHVSGPLGVSTVYRGRLTAGPTLQWGPRAITLSAGVEFKSDALWAPTQSFTVTQRLQLVLDPPTQVVSLRADGDPTVNVSLCLDEDDTVARIKAARDAALPSASAAMNQLFVTAREQLRRGLRSFDNSASVRFQRLEVTPDGLILRGAIDTKARRPTRVCMQPVVDDAGAGYTAVESWVPGGRIARYVWSLSRLLTRYIGHTGVSFTIPWKVERQPMPPERHRFRLHWGTGLALEFEQYSGVCLSIDGTQINSNGYREDVTGFGSLGSQCLPAVPEPVVVLPPGWEIFHRPLWWPDWPDVAPLDDGILAHVNCLAESLPAEGFATNHLIHFVDWSAPWPIAGLASALTKMRRERFSLATVLVFPDGTLRESRQEMERRLGLDDSVVVDPPVAGRSAVHYQIAEDTQGGWSRVFGTKRTPSSFLINARGEFVWGHAGQVAPEDLAAALDEFLLPAPAPSNKPLEMGIRPGSRLPPDWLDELLVSAGERRLRGRRALVCFWQSWSSPCLRELTRLERLYSEGTEDAVIIGLSGDQTEKPIAAVRDQLGLNFPLLHDAGLQIATRLKVKCWPTTVYISADGIVESIQFGSPPHQPKDSDRSAS